MVTCCTLFQNLLTTRKKIDMDVSNLAKEVDIEHLQQTIETSHRSKVI
jgi:hypothetical protein